MSVPPIVVIGAGSTGAAISHDLALRGLRVTLIERFGPAAGTAGHNQAQLHSGARYAVTDRASARECMEENRILRRLMPDALELNDGLFIALREEHLDYREEFLEACAQCDIPAEEISPAQALQMEPRLNPDLLAAIRIQGRERLSCITPVFRVARGGVLRLEPLRNFSVVADLVVDLNPLAHKLERVKAHVITDNESAGRFENCIECGLCISACPVAATSKDYLGPAVLAAASRNMDDLGVRSQVEGQDGVWRCHSAFECTEVCPAGVEPASAIMNLRKELIFSVIKRRGKSHE